MPDFGARLKELRIEAKMTQKELADAAGMSLGALAHIEQGLRSPAWETVVSLSNALGVKCDSFMEPPASAEKTERGRPLKEPEPDEPKRKRKGKPQ